MKTLSQVHAKHEGRFGALMRSSPDPIAISAADYLDRVYGYYGDIQLRNEGEELPRITMYRAARSPIPEEEVTFFWPMPVAQVIRHRRIDRVTTIKKNVGDWSYMLFELSVDQDLTALLHAINLKQLPVISVTAIGDSSVQILMRVRATSVKQWKARLDELLAIFEGMGVKTRDVDLSTLAALPGKHPNCNLVYFNDQLGAPLF